MGLVIGLGCNAGSGAGSGGGSGAGGGMTDILKSGIFSSYVIQNPTFNDEIYEIPEADWTCFATGSSTTFPTSWRTSVKKIGSIHNWRSNYINSQFESFTALEEGPEIIKVGNPNNGSSGVLSSLFQGCTNLKNAPKFIQHNCFTGGSINYIFYQCKSLKSIETEWVLSQPITKADGAFTSCNEVEFINLPQPFAPTDMYLCFRNCYKLKTINGVIDLQKITSTNKIESMNTLFYECNELETAYVKDLFFSTYFSSPYFSHESAVYLLNNTREGVNLTVQFRPDTFNTLTEEEVAAATQRGITIARY